MCQLVLLPPQLPGITLETCPPRNKPLDAALIQAPGHQLCLSTFNPLAKATITLFDGNRGCEPSANHLALCARPVGIWGSPRLPVLRPWVAGWLHVAALQGQGDTQPSMSLKK